jgi:hypothetical protein
MLLGIPAQCVPNVWATVAPMLKKAVDRSHNDYLLDDVLKCILEREMQLWVYEKDGIITGCCVTMIVTYPQRKICQLPYLAGKGLKEFLTQENIITEWARANGCTRLEGFDRGGWARVLTGWYKVWATIRKDI